MSSAALAFDRLAYVDRLKSGGVDEEQARAHAAALEIALGDTVATKTDLRDMGRELRSELIDLSRELRSEIADVREEIRRVETRLEAKIETSAASVKIDILRWLVVTQIALAAVILAALKFAH